MTITMPLAITPEAAGHIAKMGLQEPFQRMLENIPKRISGVHAIAVSLQDPYDLGGGPRVVIDVTRPHPHLDYDPTEENWERWIIENFPPKVFSHFCLLTIYEETDSRKWPGAMPREQSVQK